jgi:hypothetical protein
MHYFRTVFRRITLLFLCFLSLGTKAQVDTLFIQEFPHKLVLSPYLGSNANSLILTPRPIPGDTQQQELNYQPNLRGGFGISISYRVIDFSLGFRQKLSEENERLYGKTKATNLGFRLWATRHLLAEFTFQRVQGFSNRSTPSYDTLNFDRRYPYEFREDIRVNYLKLRAVYQLNPHRFSYRSSFSFSERQKKSAWGLLLNASLYSHRSRADSSFIPSAVRADFGDYGDIKTMQIVGLGLGPGIGGTWTKGRWYITGVLFLGMDVQYFVYDIPGVNTEKREFKLSNMADTRFSFGYNAPRFFIGIQNWNDYNILRPSAFQVRSLFGRALFSFGWRLESPKILDKAYDTGVNLIIPSRYQRFFY